MHLSDQNINRKLCQMVPKRCQLFISLNSTNLEIISQLPKFTGHHHLPTKKNHIKQGPKMQENLQVTNNYCPNWRNGVKNISTFKRLMGHNMNIQLWGWRWECFSRRTKCWSRINLEFVHQLKIKVCVDSHVQKLWIIDGWKDLEVYFLMHQMVSFGVFYKELWSF